MNYSRITLVACLAYASQFCSAWAADVPSNQPAGATAEQATAKTSTEDHRSKIKCVDPHTCCDESKKVLEVVEGLVHAFMRGDLDYISQHVDDHCTTFDESTKKLVSGKENVMEELKQKLHRYATSGESPLISYTIDHPYVKVTGETAVVTFVAHREIGGKHPSKMTSKVTDVFVKHEDGVWKKLHYRGSWKKSAS